MILRHSLICFVLLLLAAGGGCGGTSRVEVQEPSPPREGPRPDSEQWGAVIHLFEKGELKAVIEAEYLAVYDIPGNEYTHMDTLGVNFYDSKGDSTSHLVADVGEIYDQDREGRRKVKTWGGVVLTGSEGRVVRADTLWWDEEEDRVYTDGPVEVTEEGELFRATGFKSDTRLEEMEFGEGSGYSRRGGEYLEEEQRTESSADPDTSRATPDSLRATLPDTARAIPDSLRAAVPDTSRAIPDSLRVAVPDTGRAIPDSLRAAVPDTGMVPP